MGNSESQYSIQGPKGASIVFPGKQKPYSLKLRSAKDDALSPHTWWKSAPVGSGYKARCVGRGCLSPPKSRQPYSARHYDYVSKGARSSPSEQRWHRSPGCGIRRRHMSDEYEDNPYGAELGGNTQDRHSDEHEVLEEQSSPRVVIKKDGSLRVEFTNTSGNPLLLNEPPGPVQLLKFSPNLESASTPSLPGSSGSGLDGPCSGPPPASTSSTARTSKGSSLSSDGSWYDSPWGPSTELCEQEQSCSASRTLVHSPIHQLDSFTEQCPPVSITDLYREPSMAATFPTARDLSLPVTESSTRPEGTPSLLCLRPWCSLRGRMPRCPAVLIIHTALSQAQSTHHEWGVGSLPWPGTAPGARCARFWCPQERLHQKPHQTPQWLDRKPQPQEEEVSGKLVSEWLGWVLRITLTLIYYFVAFVFTLLYRSQGSFRNHIDMVCKTLGHIACL